MDGERRTAMLGEAAVATTARVKKLPSPVSLAAPIAKIATFHPGSLAALVATFPALVALRESFPGTSISAFARAPMLPLLECFGAVDEARGRPGGGLSAQGALMARLHASGFDISLSFSSSPNAMLLLWATGAGTRAGFAPSRLETFLTHRVEKRGPLTATAALELVESIGARPRGAKALPFFNLPPESLLRADNLVEKAGITAPFVVVTPNIGRRSKTARATRDDQIERWNTVCQQLSARWPLVVAAPRAWPLEVDSTEYPVVDVSGKADALALAALLTRGAAVVGDEAGALALGKFLERPIVAVESSTDVPHVTALKLGL